MQEKIIKLVNLGPILRNKIAKIKWSQYSKKY